MELRRNKMIYGKCPLVEKYENFELRKRILKVFEI
jgi:hypothetical protein